MASELFKDVERFNKMYGLPTPDKPAIRPVQSIKDFKSIILEEIDEGSEIIDYWEDSVDDLTNLSDWLGDLVVYCLTFARSYGLPMQEILEAIMKSNFSKLDANGNPIYDSRGKVCKGPAFIAPEPEIKAIIERRL